MRKLLFILLFFQICLAVNTDIELAVRSNNYEKSLWLTKRAMTIAKNEEMSELYYYLGASYSGLKRYGLADAAFQKFFSYQFDVEYAYKIAAYYEQREKYDLAAKAYEKILLTYPEEKNASATLGSLYFKQGKYRETIELLSEVVKKTPKKANPLGYYLGLSFMEEKDTVNAEKYLRLALDNGYNEPDIYFTLGKLSLRKGMYQQAIDEITQGMKTSIDPIPPRIYVDLGQAYAALNQLPLAEDAYKKAIGLGVDSVYLYIGFAQIAIKNKSYQEVVDVLEPVVGRYDANGDFLYDLGLACEMIKEYDKAVTYYQKAINVSPEREEAIRARIDNIAAGGQ
jgi:tetratricopeptide (TPR) repeat protein